MEEFNILSGFFFFAPKYTKAAKTTKVKVGHLAKPCSICGIVSFFLCYICFCEQAKVHRGADKSAQHAKPDRQLEGEKCHTKIK